MKLSELSRIAIGSPTEFFESLQAAIIYKEHLKQLTLFAQNERFSLTASFRPLSDCVSAIQFQPVILTINVTLHLLP